MGELPTYRGNSFPLDVHIENLIAVCGDDASVSDQQRHGTPEKFIQRRAEKAQTPLWSYVDNRGVMRMIG
jgi:hypothetical protein